ncbi:MAG: hypothetical protein QM296_06665 [Bacillota bacterium]|nr:hypothetical protein [Bacillota bacterium]
MDKNRDVEIALYLKLEANATSAEERDGYHRKLIELGHYRNEKIIDPWVESFRRRVEAAFARTEALYKLIDSLETRELDTSNERKKIHEIFAAEKNALTKEVLISQQNNFQDGIKDKLLELKRLLDESLLDKYSRRGFFNKVNKPSYYSRIHTDAQIFLEHIQDLINLIPN